MKQPIPPVEALACCLLINKQYSFLVHGIKLSELRSRHIRDYCPMTYVRYGLNSLKTQDTIFPIRVVSDYGAVYSGMSAIDWIIKKGLAHPRADVDGVMSNGVMTVCMLRELDLSVVPSVYVGGDSEKYPNRRLNGIISVEESTVNEIYSSRVRHCLPVIYISDGDDIIRSATYQVQSLV
tara:strand:+ start:109 stop:648 length:540 start_codon:yes stop_codon:yes gene_type:complete